MGKGFDDPQCGKFHRILSQPIGSELHSVESRPYRLRPEGESRHFDTEIRKPLVGDPDFCLSMAGNSDTRPVRPWGKPPTTSSGGNLVGGFLNRNKRSALWAVAPIEVAGKRSTIIPPLRLPEALIFLRFRVFCFWRKCRFFPVCNLPGCSVAVRHLAVNLKIPLP